MAKAFPSAFMLYSNEGRKAQCGCGKWSVSNDDSEKVYDAANKHLAKHMIWEWDSDAS